MDSLARGLKMIAGAESEDDNKQRFRCALILSEIDYRTQTRSGVATLRPKFTISGESYTRKPLSEIPNPLRGKEYG